MSYLIGPRIVFCGRFLGDVPTANNVRAAFEQFPQGPDPGWNPAGSGCFDFLDCHVRGGERAPGEPVGEGAPELGLVVRGAADRSSAKLVDLDPDWQNSSEIWGLSVRIVDPASAEELLWGSFRAAAFRDVWRRQLRGVKVNGMPVTASFTSVLDDVVFGPGCAAYPVLDALRQTITVPRLSIVLNVFGFFYNHVEECFATGSLTGCIGPWHAGEPLTFVAGRRLDLGQLPGPPPTVPLGRSVAAVDPAASRLVIDLGNAYPIEDHTGTPVPLPPTVTALEVGVLPSEVVSTGASLPADGARIVGEVLVEQTRRQAGIFSFPLQAADAAAARQRPLALLARLPDSRRVVVCRETRDGLYVRADQFVHRLDAGATATTTLYAVCRGQPAVGLTIHLAPGAGKGSVLAVPSQVVTGTDGTATVSLTGADPRNPRDAVDGAIETVAYSSRLTRPPRKLPDYADTGLDQGVDVLVAHVRDAFSIPTDPDWARDVQPLLAQYARLYPIMGQHLVDLGDLEAIRPWRAAMLLAMTRDITDPNHMPVTRDLSGPKRATILRWLEQLSAEPTAMARPASRPALPTAIAVTPAASGLPRRDAKTEIADAVVRRALGPEGADRTDTNEG
jgi:hypothetical protein